MTGSKGVFVDDVNYSAESGQVEIVNGKMVKSVAVCPCGQSTFEHEFGSLKQEILDGIGLALLDNQSGHRTPFETSITKHYLDECVKCHRELVSVVRGTLTEVAWEKIMVGWREASAAGVFNETIQIAAKVKGGYFSSTGGHNDVRDLLHPRCKCHGLNHASQAIDAFNKIYFDINSVLESPSPIEPQTFSQKIKCPACLNVLETEIILSVVLPTGVKNSVRVWEIWNPHQSAGVGVPIDSPPKKSGQQGIVAVGGSRNV